MSYKESFVAETGASCLKNCITDVLKGKKKSIHKCVKKSLAVVLYVILKFLVQNSFKLKYFVNSLLQTKIQQTHVALFWVHVDLYFKCYKYTNAKI